ncbi:MAG: hypothetical protein JSS63_00585 [Bacteroidetes bacterium]|nr:hypothetical protein [Bacteroidota bacterium]
MKTKIFFLLAFILLSRYAFAQSDSISLHTPAVFTITYYEYKKSLFSLNQYTTDNEVYLDILTSKYLTIRKKYPTEKNPNAVSKFVVIPLKNVKSIGYATGRQETFGAALGLGIGAVGGTLLALLAKEYDKGSGKFNQGNINSIVIPLAVWGSTGAILGYIIGGSMYSYNSTDLSSYDNKRKFDEIKKITAVGMNRK